MISFIIGLLGLGSLSAFASQPLHHYVCEGQLRYFTGNDFLYPVTYLSLKETRSANGKSEGTFTVTYPFAAKTEKDVYVGTFTMEVDSRLQSSPWWPTRESCKQKPQEFCFTPVDLRLKAGPNGSGEILKVEGYSLSALAYKDGTLSFHGIEIDFHRAAWKKPNLISLEQGFDEEDPRPLKCKTYRVSRR